MSRKEVLKAYREMAPVIRSTAGFCNGLMVLVRPAILEIIERGGGKSFSGPHSASHEVKTADGGIYLDSMPVRTWGLSMRDSYEKGKRRIDSRILDTEVRLDYRRQNSHSDRPGAYGVTRLTWGMAETAGDSETPKSYTGAGIYARSQYERERSYVPEIYLDPADLRNRYGRAGIGRIGSGLIVAQTVRVAAEQNGFEVTDPSARAEQIIEMWHDINPVGIDEAWAAFNLPIQDAA